MPNKVCIRCDSADPGPMIKSFIREHPELLPVSTIMSLGSGWSAVGVLVNIETEEQVDKLLELGLRF